MNVLDPNDLPDDAVMLVANALGWGATDRPMPTVTSGGTAIGGAEPIARGGRAALARSKRGGGAWL
jgi:DNA (cytosine-5)-methyltransferase 1